MARSKSRRRSKRSSVYSDGTFSSLYDAKQIINRLSDQPRLRHSAKYGDCLYDTRYSLNSQKKIIDSAKRERNSLKNCLDKMYCADYPMNGNFQSGEQFSERTSKIISRLNQVEKTILQARIYSIKDLTLIIDTTIQNYNNKIQKVMMQLVQSSACSSTGYNYDKPIIEKENLDALNLRIDQIDSCLNEKLKNMQSMGMGFQQQTNEGDQCSNLSSNILGDLFLNAFKDNKPALPYKPDLPTKMIYESPTNILQNYGPPNSERMFSEMMKSTLRTLFINPENFARKSGKYLPSCFINMFSDTERVIINNFKRKLLACKLFKYLFAYSSLLYLRTFLHVYGSVDVTTDGAKGTVDIRDFNKELENYITANTRTNTTEIRDTANLFKKITEQVYNTHGWVKTLETINKSYPTDAKK